MKESLRETAECHRLQVMAHPHTTPRWFTPGRLLALLCYIDLVYFLNRGALASNGINGAPTTPEREGYGIQGDLGLTLFQDGLLPSALSMGIVLSSPCYAEASKHWNAQRLVGAGAVLWGAAALGCGLAPGFLVLLLCRAAMGLGGAPFDVLASTLLDDHAPPAQKARWFAALAMCVPVGYASGFALGGWVGTTLGWRALFFIEAVAIAPVAVFCLTAEPVHIRHGHKSRSRGSKAAAAAAAGPADVAAEVEPQGEGAAYSDVQPLLSDEQQVGLRGQQAQLGDSGGRGSTQLHRASQQQHSSSLPQGQPPELQAPHCSSSSSGSSSVRSVHGGGPSPGVLADLLQLARSTVYVIFVSALVLYHGGMAAMAYYSPKAGRDVFSVAPEWADLAFGIITILTGICGSLAGGVVLDRLGPTLSNALLMGTLGTGCGSLLLLAGFGAAPSFPLFCLAIALGEFAMFMTEAPARAICMWSVPPALRPAANSGAMVASIVLGSAPAPPLLGLLQTHLANWRLSMCACSLLVLGAAALYATARLAARTATDYNQATVKEVELEGGESGLGWGVGAEAPGDRGLH